MHSILHDLTTHEKGETSQANSAFVNKASLYATAHEQSWSFFTKIIPQQRYQLMQYWMNSRLMLFSQIPCLNSRSGRPRTEPVNKYDYRR